MCINTVKAGVLVVTKKRLNSGTVIYLPIKEIGCNLLFSQFGDAIYVHPKLSNLNSKQIFVSTTWVVEGKKHARGFPHLRRGDNVGRHADQGLQQAEAVAHRFQVRVGPPLQHGGIDNLP